MLQRTNVVIAEADENENGQLSGDDLSAVGVSFRAVHCLHKLAHTLLIKSLAAVAWNTATQTSCRTSTSARRFLPLAVTTHEIASNALDKYLIPIGVYFCHGKDDDIRPIRFGVKDPRRLQIEKVSRALALSRKGWRLLTLAKSPATSRLPQRLPRKTGKMLAG
jgi:hypothetical protein